MKRYLIFVLAAVLLLALMPAGIFGITAIAAPSEQDGLTYEVYDGEATITGCTSDISILDIPESVGGYPVTSIGAYAFEGSSTLTSVTIPDTVQTIADGAFQYCSELKSVKLGNGVKIVGKRAFTECDALSQVDLGQSVQTIDAQGFGYNHQLTDLDFPASLRYLGEEAFSNCTGLVSLSFPEGLVSIGVNCFCFCDNLTEVHLPDSLKEIKDGGFYSCEKISVLTLGKELNTIGDSAFHGCVALESLTIPGNVQTIGKSAFYECISLQQVDLGRATQVGNSAFESCTSLTKVHIPAATTSIGRSAFAYCPAMEQMTVSTNNPIYHSQGNCIIETRSKKIISGCKNSIIPDDGSVTVLDSYSFAGCSELKSIVVPDQVTMIHQYAFYECYSLEFMQLPFVGGESGYDNWIGYIFGGGPSQNDLYVPSTLKKVVITGGTKVGNNGFSKCSGLEEIVLPESITTIGYSAFERCPNLQRIIIPGDLKEIKHENVLEKSPNATLYISAGQDRTYEIVQALNLPCQQGGLITFLDKKGQCIDRVWYPYGEQIVAPDVPEQGDEPIYWEPAPGICTGNQTIQLGGNTDSGDTVCDHSSTVILSAKAATCTETGLTEGKKCAVCNEILIKQETVPAAGHSWGEWKVTKPATAAEVGEEKRSCTVCAMEETRSVDKLGNPFMDVQAGKFYETPVIWAVENGITNGMDETHFAPDTTCNRGQVVTFLWRAAGSPEPSSTNNPFTDVKEGKFYYKAVLWAVENGITNGTSATAFSPDSDCTRGQVATFLWRSLQEPAASSSFNPFTDVEKGKFYYDAVLWAVDAEVTNGMTATTFAPNNSCTRGQIVTFLYRALG